LTLTICKRALDDLEVAWPDATYTLAHVWTAKMTPYAYERKALAAHIVAFADKISSQHSKFEAAFHSAPAHRHFVEWEDEWYWRPLPPAA
jgi:hypothetical protein